MPLGELCFRFSADGLLGRAGFEVTLRPFAWRWLFHWREKGRLYFAVGPLYVWLYW